MARTAQLKTEVLDILAKWSAYPQEGDASGLSRECQLWRAIGEAMIADNSASLQAPPVNKMLEARRLIVIHPVLAKEGTRKKGLGTWTAVVHLRRFAPRLNEEYYFKEVGAEGEWGQYVISNDFSQQMRGVCELLQGANNRILLEYDVKQTMGFRKTEGKRLWTRLRSNLETGGYMRSFGATIGNDEENECKPKTVLELLKPYPSPGAGEEEGSDEPVERVDLVAEKGLDWQIINLLLEAGREGVLKHRLTQMLRLNPKKWQLRLRDIKACYSIIETDVQEGKQVVKLWKWPKDLLLHHQRTGLPAPLEGDHIATTLNAMASTPDAGPSATAQENPVVEGPPDAQMGMSSDGVGDEPQVSLEFVSVKNPDTTRTLISQLAHDRLQHLVGKVEEEGFLLRNDVTCFLLDHEKSSVSAMDARTIGRIVQCGVFSGKFHLVNLIEPADDAGGKAIVTLVLLHPGLELEGNPVRISEILSAENNRLEMVRERGDCGETAIHLEGIHRLPQPKTAAPKRHNDGKQQKRRAPDSYGPPPPTSGKDSRRKRQKVDKQGARWTPALLRPWEPIGQTIAAIESGAQTIGEEADGGAAAELPQESEEDMTEPKTSKAVGCAWTANKDRFVLKGFVKWHAAAGFKDKAFRAKPLSMHNSFCTERLADRRLKSLQQDSKTGTFIMDIVDTIKEVTTRMLARGDGPKLEDSEEQRPKRLRKAHL